MEYTYKTLADELGVSKTAIRKRIANLKLETSLRKNGNKFVIPEHVAEQVKECFIHADKKPKTETITETSSQTKTETINSNVSDTAAIIEALRAELEILNKQLTVKDEQIARLDQRLAETTAALRELNGTDALRLAASHSDNVEVVETVENIADTANDSPDKADITIVEDEQAEQTLLERIRAFMARLFN